MTRTGSCLCGDITYEIAGDALATAVCHCEHCQRQSGGAFSTNLVVRADQMTVSGDLKVYEDRGRTGDAVYVLRKFCSNCGSPIVSELMEPADILAVKVGTLDERADIAPQIQVWCDDKQPWIELAGIAAKDQE
jgi:hypothetical protein